MIHPARRGSRSRARCVAITALAACLAAPAARADWFSTPAGAGGSYTRPEFPTRALVDQPLTLSQGLWRLEVPVVVNLSTGEVGKPVLVPVALDYGVTSDATVGLYHDRGLCLSSRATDCNGVYDDLGARVRLSVLRTGGAQVVAQAGLLASRFDDLAWDSSVGLAGKATLGRFAVLAQVNVAVALSGRDTRFYKELLTGQLDGQVQIGSDLAAFAYAGAASALQVIRPYEIPAAFPAGLGAEWSPSHHLTLSAQLAFPDLFGRAGGSDRREARIALRGWL